MSSSESCESKTNVENISDSSNKRKARKISDIHLESASRLPEAETGRNEKRLTLESLVEAVAILAMPSMPYAFTALKHVLEDTAAGIWSVVLPLVPVNDRQCLKAIDLCTTEDVLVSTDAGLLNRLVELASARTDQSLKPEDLLRQTGRETVKYAVVKHERQYVCLGFTLCDMLNSFDALTDRLENVFPNVRHVNNMASFRCVQTAVATYNLHVSSQNRQLKYFMCGVISELSNQVFHTEVDTSILQNTSEDLFHYVICITDKAADWKDNIVVPANIPANPCTSLPAHIMCHLFPFHVIFDRKLCITQLGASLTRLISEHTEEKRHHLGMHFEIVKPIIHMTFSAILARVNSSFELFCKCAPETRHAARKTIHLHGQMVHLPDCSSMIFLGSPLVSQVDEMIGRGLYFTDIPIHDATRDLILVGQQTKAQDVLKRKMVTIKEKLEEASTAVGIERQKNVDLLNLVFPADIAKQLWLGESVPPRRIDDVTMLFSDIVGFTSICSTATPMEVITMLSTIYTKFDALCEFLGVYKTETIGDAYCVAGGLHRPSTYHAAQTTWMAIKMLEEVHLHNDPMGKPLQMRIGLHTGPILAGVVGIKMPRYCLFGNNVTIANKMESTGQPDRIHISHTTYEELAKVPVFQLEEKSEMMEPCLGKRSYFVNNYEDLDASGLGVKDHVSFAMKKLNLSA